MVELFFEIATFSETDRNCVCFEYIYEVTCLNLYVTWCVNIIAMHVQLLVFHCVGICGMCMLRSGVVLIAYKWSIVHCMAWLVLKHRRWNGGFTFYRRWSLIGNRRRGFDPMWKYKRWNFGFTIIDVDPRWEIDVEALILCGNIGGGTLGPQVGTAFAFFASCHESHA